MKRWVRFKGYRPAEPYSIDHPFQECLVPADSVVGLRDFGKANFIEANVVEVTLFGGVVYHAMEGLDEMRRRVDEACDG